MQKNILPSPLVGQWMWQKSLNDKSDTFVFFRREFSVPGAVRQADFWISANTAYQLFVNGRLIGFGPRARHSAASSYVDQYDLSEFLEIGVNVIGIVAYHSVDKSGVPYGYRPAGVWCQLDVDNRIRIGSDALWQMHEGRCFNAPRPRTRKGQVLTDYFDATDFDSSWTDSSFLNMPPWPKPDSLTVVEEFGTLLEAQPFPPPRAETPVPLEEIERGGIENLPCHTQVLFAQVYRHGEWSYAAEAFVFSKEARRVRTRFYADDPVRVFCGHRSVLSGDFFEGAEHDLVLDKGWTRILVVMTPTRCSMGLMLVFPDGELKSSDFKLVPQEKARAAWHLSHALRMPLTEATGSLKLGELADDETFTHSERTLADAADLLRDAEFHKNDNVSTSALNVNEYAIYKLDAQRYGFPQITFYAGEGDLVDISVGLTRADNGFPARGRAFRGTHTVRCRKGLNRMLFFAPRECFYVMVSVRRTTQAVELNNVEFIELTRTLRGETQFKCSDDTLNAMWRAGRNQIARAASVIPLAEPMARQDIFLIDSFLQAINVAAVFGDAKYSEKLLSEILSEQFENGNIPVLTSSNRHVTQINHLFVLPVWIAYNCRLTGREDDIPDYLPAIGLVCDFFASRATQGDGLLLEEDGSIDTRINALYCRFLLSAAELYRAANDKAGSARCMAEANTVAARLKKANLDPASGLFCDSSRGGARSAKISFTPNFYALYGGVLPMSAFETFFGKFCYEQEPYLKEELSGYTHFLFCEMLFALRRHDWALNYLIDYWKQRFNAVSCAWKRNNNSDPALVRFHDGILMTPNLFFVREIAGVRLAGAAHSKIYFSPALKLVNFAELALHTAYGRIKLRWEKLPDDLIDVTIDANFPLQVIPEMTAEELKRTQFALGDNVVLMSAAE